MVDLEQALHLRESEVRRVLKAMARQREVVEVTPDHFFDRSAMAEVAVILADIAATELRDRLDNGRKVAIQMLEHFDRQGVTLRRGDLRHIDPRRLRLFLGTAQAFAAG